MEDMVKNGIKNIVLDMGNVIMDYNPEISLNLYGRTEEERDIIRRELFQGPEWVKGDLGEISDRARYELVKQRVPEKYWPALKQCVDGWEICMKPLPGAKEFCEAVKSSGYGLYILSNASDLFYEYFPNFAPFDYFDGIVVSCDIHIIKPDVRIYQYLLEKYHLTAEECLFIDDRADNVQGAKKAGMKGIVFQNNLEEIWTMLHT